MKTRVLWVNECSVLNTGYAVYGREVMKRLYASDQFEIAELACYVHSQDPRLQQIPWRVYPNVPDPDDEIGQQQYNSNNTNQFGEYKFHDVCLDFRPHVVINITDFWMHEHVDRSPYRKYFNWCIMPTVDSYPQHQQWIDTYKRANGVFTYQDWSLEVLKKEGNGRIPLLCSAPPSAEPEFQPIAQKQELKKQLGLGDYKIVGTVMRNQRRKLFPDLFKAFRKFLDKTGRDDIVLYCHTSYPDFGWDIPKLITQNNLHRKVILTYKCKNCGHIFPLFFNDVLTTCIKCAHPSAGVCSVQDGAPNNILSAIINCFDLYAQYSNCLTPGQKVKTKDGWTNIEEIKIGEYVLTHTGNYQKVKDTFVHENNNKVYEIGVHGDCEKLQLTAEHPVYVVSTKVSPHCSVREYIGSCIRTNQTYQIECKFVPAKDIQPGDLLVSSYDSTINDINQLDMVEFLEKEQNIIQKESYLYNDNKVAIKRGDFYNRFLQIDNNFCKFLGLYMADGTSTYDKQNKNIRISCHIQEKTNIDLSYKILEQISNKKPTIRTYNSKNAVSIESYCSLYALWFRQLGIQQHKALPQWCLNLPIEKQKQIIHGLFMGDGHYCAKKNMSIYCTISEPLYNQIKELAIRIGLVFNVRKVNKSGNRKPQYRFEFRGNIKNGEFDTQRSSTRSLNHNNQYIRQVKTIKEIKYNGYVYNIEVANDNSYTHKICSIHNSEGFGIPVVEAAACGIPVMATDFSAMNDVIRKLGGIPIPVLHEETELETGCHRAIPNMDKFVNLLEIFFGLSEEERHQLGVECRRNFEKHYNWDETANKWGSYIASINAEHYEKLWHTPPNLQQPSNQIPDNLNNVEFVKWLIVNVLQEPERLNTYFETRMIHDLNYGAATVGTAGMYFNEMSQLFGRLNWNRFTREEAYKHMYALWQRKNELEQRRWASIQQRR